MRPIRLLSLSALVVPLLLAPVTRAAPAAAFCEFTLGFETIRALIPDAVGDCLENEHPDPRTGNTVQRTSTGLLVWRKADNWTAFTNGESTWVRGPCGLQSRLNTDLLPFERGESPPCSGVYQGDPQPVAITAADLGSTWILSNQKFETQATVNKTQPVSRYLGEFHYGYYDFAGYAPSGANFVRDVVTVFWEPAGAEYVWPAYTTATPGFEAIPPPPLGDASWAETRSTDLGALGTVTDVHYVARVQNVLVEVYVTGRAPQTTVDSAVSLAQMTATRIQQAENPPAPPPG